jgi:hypothetical protein
MRQRRLLSAALLTVIASLAHAQASCPPHASAYATTTDGDTTTVHCQCDRGYIIGGDGCIAAPVSAEPALPTIAGSTQTVGSTLGAMGTAYVPNASAASYLERARTVLNDFLLGKLKSSALKGSVLGVEVSSPMGYFIAIEINTKQSIPWVTSQISEAAAGNLTAEQAGKLPIELANRIFDVGSPANDVVANGVVGAGLDAAQDKVTEGVTGGVASLASSVFPAGDEMKQSISESSPKIAANLQSLIHAWTKTAPNQEHDQ